VYDLAMTLRPMLAAAVLLAAPAAQAADPSSASTTAESGTRAETSPPVAMPRKVERKQPGAPARPRIFDAPGAALMMIPAAWSPDRVSTVYR